jgi:class 3 adenylate cyclase
VIQVADLIRSRAAAGEVLVSGTLRDLVSNSAIVFKSHGRLELEPMGEWQILKVQRV